MTSSVTSAPQSAPEAQEKEESITLKVAFQDGLEMYFKIRKTVKLSKLMGACCTRLGIDLGSTRFLYDGKRLQPDQTPESLEMETDDVIDAVRMQTGGR